MYRVPVILPKVMGVYGLLSLAACSSDPSAKAPTLAWQLKGFGCRASGLPIGSLVVPFGDYLIGFYI